MGQPLNCSPPKKVRQMSTSGVSSTNGNDVIVASISNTGYNSTTDVPSSSHKTTTTIVPVSTNSGNNSNIFAKIGRLNEALQAINPRYQPIGFSITSMESCSPARCISSGRNWSFYNSLCYSSWTRNTIMG